MEWTLLARPAMLRRASSLSLSSSLAALLPVLASVVACGGAIASVEGTGENEATGGGGDTNRGSRGSSTSGGYGSSSGGSSSSSGSTSGGSTSSSGGTGGFDVDVCDGAAYHPLEDLSVPTRPSGSAVAYFELRNTWPSVASDDYTIIAQAGTRCAGAADVPACESAVAAVKSTGWPMSMSEGPLSQYVVATAGDEVIVLSTLEQLKAFLLPIDTAKDAALLLTAGGRYHVRCGAPQARRTTTGWELAVESGHTCGPDAKREAHVVAVGSDGAEQVLKTTLLEKGDPNCAIGRRPAGLVARPEPVGAPLDGIRALARFFAEAAHLEAASVFAFDRLAEELVMLGAPRALVDAALTSREDEVRHARMTRTMAKRFGGSVTAPVIETDEAERSPFAIALENAVEGCVRETYGALVAHWQAAHAEDRGIAAAMRAIADDETRHAGLAWEVAAWLEPRLGEDERRAVAAARAHALAALRAELRASVDASLVSIAGMPRPDDALALLDALEATHLRDCARFAA
jgi:hypothetical protein